MPAADVHIGKHQELPPALLRFGSQACSSEEARAPSGHCYSSLIFDRNRSGCNGSVVTYRCQTGSLILFALSATRHASRMRAQLMIPSLLVINVNRVNCREAALSTRSLAGQYFTIHPHDFPSPSKPDNQCGHMPGHPFTYINRWSLLQRCLTSEPVRLTRQPLASASSPAAQSPLPHARQAPSRCRRPAGGRLQGGLTCFDTYS